jgi:hypothetical protein
VVNPFVVWQGAAQSRAQNGWEREMGQRIRQETSGPCSVLATDVPQITWYSGCEAYNFGNRGTDGDRDRLLTNPERFLVLRGDGLFQPVGPLMAGYLSRVSPAPVAIIRRPDGSIGGTLYRFR